VEWVSASAPAAAERERIAAILANESPETGICIGRSGVNETLYYRKPANLCAEKFFFLRKAQIAIAA
jgi:hypothetical protein